MRTVPLSPEAMPRRTRAVVQRLLDEMGRIVRDYHPEVRRTGCNLAELIPGTAMFPGGSGLWRGSEPFGVLPEWFPYAPVMFVGHNFDSMTAYDRSKKRGGEAQSFFWQILCGYLHGAGVPVAECFFTNFLMGLKPGSAIGAMPTVAGFEEQCQRFFLRQVEIAAPRVVIALGGDAARRVAKAAPGVRWLPVMHPSAREFKPLATRSVRVAGEAAKIGDFIAR